MRQRRLTPLVAAILAYTAVTAVLGRDVLAHLSTTVAQDVGDPLFTAAILKWNATHVPVTDAWWQFPIYHPTRDALALSEHLLGLSIVATPIYWITQNPLVTYNIVTLLTFPLCATAMCLLVFRLTGSAAGAFVAGLAFGFAPYRISQMPHVQMLAAFWAPLALLGLHAYLDTGRRRWLVLYGATWALQAAANGYALFFFSLLIGLWVLWFVVARRQWRALAMIAAATVLAILPLAPVLYKYVLVHARYGLARGIDEMRAYSGDVVAVLCAPDRLTFWGWVRVMCKPEGELFPGAAVAAISIAAFVRTLGWFRSAGASRLSQVVTYAGRTLVVVGLLYGGIVVSVLLFGPWRLDVGFTEVSASSVGKPLLIAVTAFALALILAPGVRSAIRHGSTIGFYLLATLATWLFTLGPTITFMREPTGYDGPFMWLLALPGANGLRVPARFWLMTMICLAIVVGLFVADILRGRRKITVAAFTLVASCAVLADGWVDRIPAAPAPPGVEHASSLAGHVVLEIPMGSTRDIAAQFRAVMGGWKTVNGYSGYSTTYYPALIEAVRWEDDALFRPFQRDGELDVIVPEDAIYLKRLIERQPGVTVTGKGALGTFYRLPRRAWSVSGGDGERIRVARLESTCGTVGLPLALDGDDVTRWICPPARVQELIVDLGRTARVGALVHGMGPYFAEGPRILRIETSIDGTTWQPAWDGSVLAQLIAAGMRDPKSLRIAVPFEPREARYLRVQPINGERDFHWSIAELEVRTR